MTTPTPTHGDNGGPKVNAEFETIAARISDLYDEARNWADGEPIASAEVAEAVTALFDGLHAAGNEAEALRKAEVRPLDDAKAEVQARFHGLIGDTKQGKGKVLLGKAALQTLLSAWRAAEQKRAQEAADKARREAEAEMAKAEELIRASAGNLEAREVAEEVLAGAKEAGRFAAKQEKAATVGTGLRTVWVADLKDEGLALDWAYTRSPERFRELVVSMAEEAVRLGVRVVPGFDVREERVATTRRAG